MKKYEAHITLPLASKEIAQMVGDSFGWSFSQILGDPIMGKGAYCYLTRYRNNSAGLFRVMQEVVAELTAQGVEVLRTKIELIVFDSKTGVDLLGEQT